MPGRKPLQSPEDGLVAAVASGDRRKALEALRDDLAVALAGCELNVKANISGQLRAVLADLAALPDDRQESKSDELAGRAAKRLADANVTALAGRRRLKSG